MKITGIFIAFLACTLCFAEPKPRIKILSIDGGGIRGIIPIKILSYMESKLKTTSITNHFDIMGGTSAGGIITLLLNIPDEYNQPKYNAKYVYTLYKKIGKDIFTQSFFYRLRTFNGWIGAKYDSEMLEKYLHTFMEDYTILDSVKDIIIPAYDLLEDKNYFFRKTKAKETQSRNFYLKDIARATSAAPTYFKPAELMDAYGIEQHVMVDGGVSVNNPALSALVYAFSQYGKDVEYIVISIGTGAATKTKQAQDKNKDIPSSKLGWANDIVPLLMDSVNDVTDYQMQEILGKGKYYRLQVTIDPKHSDMDNASEDNIKALEAYADKFISDNEALLEEIIGRIT
jgi:patatin-like phospholipase/acyl hydrolase